MKKKQESHRIEIYLPAEEREAWERALALSKERSMSAFLRVLVARELARSLKAAAGRGA